MVPFILLLLLCSQLIVSSTVATYGSDSCSGTEVFEFQAELDTCYNNPVIGTCDAPPGCANSDQFRTLDLNEILEELDCTNIGDSFMVDSDGDYHRWSDADCTGLEITGPLNNPCLPLHICGSQTADYTRLRNKASSSSVNSPFNFL